MLTIYGTKKTNPVYSLQTLLFVMVWNLGQHDFAAERCWRRSYFMCVTTVLVWTRQRLQLTEPGGCGGRLRLTNKLIVFWGVSFLFCILRLVRQGCWRETNTFKVIKRIMSETFLRTVSVLYCKYRHSYNNNKTTAAFLKKQETSELSVWVSFFFRIHNYSF